MKELSNLAASFVVVAVLTTVFVSVKPSDLRQTYQSDLLETCECSRSDNIVLFAQLCLDICSFRIKVPWVAATKTCVVPSH